MSPVRRRFGDRRPREPFDWPLFLRKLYLQPVPIWLAFNALSRPFGAAAPRLLGASCGGRARQALASLATAAFVAVVPPVATALVYLLAARRRLTAPAHRAIADATFALLAAVSLWYAGALGLRAERIHGALEGLRAVCWP